MLSLFLKNIFSDLQHPFGVIKFHLGQGNEAHIHLNKSSLIFVSPGQLNLKFKKMHTSAPTNGTLIASQPVQLSDVHSKIIYSGEGAYVLNAWHIPQDICGLGNIFMHVDGKIETISRNPRVSHDFCIFPTISQNLQEVWGEYSSANPQCKMEFISLPIIHHHENDHHLHTDDFDVKAEKEFTFVLSRIPHNVTQFRYWFASPFFIKFINCTKAELNTSLNIRVIRKKSKSLPCGTINIPSITQRGGILQLSMLGYTKWKCSSTALIIARVLDAAIVFLLLLIAGVIFLLWNGSKSFSVPNTPIW